MFILLLYAYLLSLLNNILNIHESKMGMKSLIFYFWEYLFNWKTGRTFFLPWSCYLLMSCAKKKKNPPKNNPPKNARRVLIEYHQSQIVM